MYFRIYLIHVCTAEFSASITSVFSFTFRETQETFLIIKNYWKQLLNIFVETMINVFNVTFGWFIASLLNKVWFYLKKKKTFDW